MKLQHRGIVSLAVTSVVVAFVAVPATVVAAPRPAAAGTARTVSAPIAASADDAQEGGGMNATTVTITSATDDLGDNLGQSRLLTGLRFRDLPIPRGATIDSASIQFTSGAVSTPKESASLTIRGQAADNAGAFAATAGNISARPLTSAAVVWSPPDWTLANEAGPAEDTPDLSPIVQAIVDRQGWQSGNALAFVVSGTGRRSAWAFDGNGAVPRLDVHYTPANQAPTVKAGKDQTVVLPSRAQLSAHVDDDGLPDPPGTTTLTWSKVSGPGTVTFADSANAATSAGFSVGGVYVLKATVTDGALSSSDTLTVTAEAAPVVDAGADQTVKLPAEATLHGTAVDNGFPDSVKPTWSAVSGPGDVTFDHPHAWDTTASFSVPGEYELQLLGVNSGNLAGTDQVMVTATPADLTITFAPQPTSLLAGQLVTLQGHVTRTANGAPVSGEVVTVTAYRAPRSRAETLGPVTTAADGTFTVTDRPQVITRYVAANTQGLSAPATVQVRPRLRAHFTRAAVRRGQRAVVIGAIAPAAGGQPLLLQGWTGTGWVTRAATTTRAADRAVYRVGVRLHQAGRYRFRVLAPAYAGRARAVTPTLHLVVRR